MVARNARTNQRTKSQPELVENIDQIWSNHLAKKPVLAAKGRRSRPSHGANLFVASCQSTQRANQSLNIAEQMPEFESDDTFRHLCYERRHSNLHMTQKKVMPPMGRDMGSKLFITDDALQEKKPPG